MVLCKCEAFTISYLNNKNQWVIPNKSFWNHRFTKSELINKITEYLLVRLFADTYFMDLMICYAVCVKTKWTYRKATNRLLQVYFVFLVKLAMTYYLGFTISINRWFMSSYSFLKVFVKALHLNVHFCWAKNEPKSPSLSKVFLMAFWCH